MKPVVNNSLTVNSTMPGLKGQFTVDADSMAHIMSLLTNLYSDPEEATIREYITNAWDSHQQSGQTRPVEVNTPGKFNGVFVIRDFGQGMSVDDIVQTYSKYGSSTKRDTNNAVGMFGVGSKSALTYTNQFTVVAVKNGVKAHVLIFMNEDGVPEYNVVDTRATDEPNGVEVTIPAKSGNSFDAKTEQFLRYWPKGSVLFNGKEVEGLEAQGYKEAAPGIWINPNKSGMNTTRTVVMGNVPYKVETAHLPRGIARESYFSWVIEVPIGTVEIVPSREALNYTDATNATLAKRVENISSLYVDSLLKDLAACKTPIEAWKMWHRLPHGITRLDQRLDEFTHSGVKIKYASDISVGKSGYNSQTNKYEYPAMYAYPNGVKWKYADTTSISMHRLEGGQTAIVTNHPGTKPNADYRRKLMKYSDDNNLGHAWYLIKDSDVKSPMLEGIHRVDHSVISAVVVPKPPRNNANRPKELPFRFWEATDDPNARPKYKGDNAVEVKPKNNQSVIYYHETDITSNRRYYGGVDKGNLVDWFPKGTRFVDITKGQVTRLKRLNPHVKSLEEGLKDLFSDLALRAGQRYNLSEDNTKNFVKNVDVARIKDKELKAEVVAAKQNSLVNDVNSEKMISIRQSFNYTKINCPSVNYKHKEMTVLKERYPLAVKIGVHADIYDYINDKYERKYK